MGFSKAKITGLTKDVGFQVGTRRTFAVDAATMWDFLFSAKGLGLWLGEILGDGIAEGTDLQTKSGLRIMVRVFKPHSHIRMKYQPRNWRNNSTVQIRIIDRGEKTIVSFHQEHLADLAQREEMKIHWQTVVAKIAAHFG